MKTKPFWLTTELEDMTTEQWESLCDGCGKCCVYKIEDDEDVLYQTDVACRYFDHNSCRCSQYEQRFVLVPDCIQVTPAAARKYEWLPNTCAYKLLAQGHDIPDWHPLKTGDPESVHKANRSARNKVICETQAGELDDHIIAILIPDDPESDPLSEIESE
ncbi:YcgN family cysteine cluster protein [Pleionea sp. CnH1-48]|uniref:YcgN family cysteine cluster protein n=1 Tax=Pleionea sp. CnH1-48 TaxID=2954494 RepID=UPI00209808FF|nr:YcgN family cysteine cluster protein [Pleionea sp. CnH1-48]MCO7227269.1 YcgN family cysteine cluster protein [Pleionea sp. CnH1-48]